MNFVDFKSSVISYCLKELVYQAYITLLIKLCMVYDIFSSSWTLLKTVVLQYLWTALCVHPNYNWMLYKAEKLSNPAQHNTNVMIALQ